MRIHNLCTRQMQRLAGFITILILTMSMLLTGCGARASDSSASADSELYYEEADTAPDTASMGTINAMQKAANGSVSFDGNNAYPAESGNAYSRDVSDAEAPVDADSLNAEAAKKDSSRKLIRNVNISMETTQLDKLTTDVTNRVKALGGYIEYSWLGDNGYNSDDTRYVNYTLRIPADKLDDFLNTALAAGRITSQSENVEDITLRYSDLESKVRTLETEQERLQELIGSAQDVDAIIALETRLSEIRYELDSIKSSLKVYDNQVTYSTVTIYISEVKVAAASKSDTFAERVAAGFSESLVKLKDDLENAAVTLIVSIPAVIVGIILLVAALLIIKLAVKAVFRILGIKIPEKMKGIGKKKVQ